MKLEYIINEQDFLQQQLYAASKSKHLKSQSRKTLIYTAISILILSLLLLYFEDQYIFYNVIILGFIYLIMLPFYLKYYYKKHFQKIIKETYKNRFGEIVKIELLEKEFSINDANSETKLKYSAFDEFIEIEHYYFLKLKTGESLIIPTSQIVNLVELKVELNNIAAKYNIKQTIELNWKWK